MQDLQPLPNASVREVGEIEEFISAIAPFAKTKTHIVFSEVPIVPKIGDQSERVCGKV